MIIQSQFKACGETKKQKILHRPGIEPGPPAWQASILPLNQRCFDVFESKIYLKILPDDRMDGGVSWSGCSCAGSWQRSRPSGGAGCGFGHFKRKPVFKMSCLKTYNASPRLKWKNLPRPLIKKTVSSLNIRSKRQEQFGISHYGCVLLSQIPRLDKNHKLRNTQV